MPDDQAEFDEAWARIVEDLNESDPDLAAGTGTGARSSTPPAEAEPSPATPEADQGLAALFEPLRRREPAPDAFVDNWEDEGHFTPPEPPEIPTGTPVKRLAWTGALGGPAVLVLAALTGWDAPTVVTLGAGLAALAGFATLVWHLPDSHGDGWDDGARL
jgi:hypothetical protein